MNKKFLLIIGVLTVVTVLWTSIVHAYENDTVYNDFLNTVRLYDESKLVEDVSYNNVAASSDDTLYIFKKIFGIVFSEIRYSMKYFLEIIFICIISSISRAFITKKDLCEICGYACFCVCAYLIVSSFKLISDTCLEAINNILDFMKIALPTYASVVAGCGYVAMASNLQNIFMLVSVIISDFIVKIVYPLLYYCGLLTSINGISVSINFTRFIKLISKIIKYAVGIIMTIFAGIISFAGFSAGAGDNIAVKTIKYTVSNFVPVVGTCLSEALNSIMNSSIAVKNSIGYLGLIGIISVCMFPVIKVCISVIIFRLAASVADLFSETSLGTMIDSVCDVMSTMISLLFFIIAVFVLIIGIMTSVG